MDYKNNLNDFADYFWQYIDRNIVSIKDRSTENRQFCESVCFDCFRMYQQSDISIDQICKIAENMLFNVYRFKPMLGQ